MYTDIHKERKKDREADREGARSPERTPPFSCLVGSIALKARNNRRSGNLVDAEEAASHPGSGMDFFLTHNRQELQLLLSYIQKN